jgi:signal transduction histidine kinase
MPDSKSQVRLAHAVLEGTAKGTGMGKSFAREIVHKMRGKRMASLPQHVKKGSTK